MPGQASLSSAACLPAFHLSSLAVKCHQPRNDRQLEVCVARVPRHGTGSYVSRRFGRGRGRFNHPNIPLHSFTSSSPSMCPFSWCSMRLCMRPDPRIVCRSPGRPGTSYVDGWRAAPRTCPHRPPHGPVRACLTPYMIRVYGAAETVGGGWLRSAG